MGLKTLRRPYDSDKELNKRSEQLREKKIKDLVNLAKSELRNYNHQKVFKVETEDIRNRIKLLKKIVDLQKP